MHSLYPTDRANKHSKNIILILVPFWNDKDHVNGSHKKHNLNANEGFIKKLLPS